MKERFYVTVAWPITVAEGGYCWKQGSRICDHYDNEGGWSRCQLGVGRPIVESGGDVKKPPQCLALKEVTS